MTWTSDDKRAKLASLPGGNAAARSILGERRMPEPLSLEKPAT
jgi:hypothetical protein